VAVVGGGPAGSRAAELLAGGGARVVLYEPRTGWEKPCGGGVPERAIDSCPFLRAPSLPQRVCPRARIFSASGREASVPLAEPLRIYSRRELNGCFMDRARLVGAELVAARVTSLSRSGSIWQVGDSSGRKQSFDFLVGADGASGVVRGRVLGKSVPLDQTIGLGFFLDGYSSDEIVLKFFPGLVGYLWIFPRTDHLAVGICGPAGKDPGALRESLVRFLCDLYGAGVLRRLRNYGARIPSIPPRVSLVSSCQGSGWALLGDAAGFVDPITREGIHYALASAEHLAGALRLGRPELYAARCAESWGEELSWASRHRDLFFSARFLEAFTLLSSASRAVQEVVADLIAGRQSYRMLSRRLAGRGPSALVSLLARPFQRLRVEQPAAPPPKLRVLPGNRALTGPAGGTPSIGR
jgi:flavin-dependent dehydrogenase